MRDKTKARGIAEAVSAGSLVEAQAKLVIRVRGEAVSAPSAS